MGGAALQEAGIRDADLDAREVGLDEVLEELAGAAQLGMAEGVSRRISRDVVAVGVGETLGDDDLAELLALQDAADVLEALLLVKGNLGEIDQVRRVVRLVAAFREAALAAIQPEPRPMTSMMETRSPWPRASWSAASSRTDVARYFAVLP